MFFNQVSVKQSSICAFIHKLFLYISNLCQIEISICLPIYIIVLFMHHFAKVPLKSCFRKNHYKRS